MPWDSQELKRVDLGIVFTVSFLLIAGLVAVYSATQSSSPALANNFVKQLAWVFLGTIVLSVVVTMPMKWFKQYAYLVYFFSLGLLVLVLIFGKGQGAVHRWFVIGPIRFQPSEIAKITTVFALARYLSEEQRNCANPTDVLMALAIAAIPMALVAKEPDLGTALVFAALVLPMMFWAGLSLFSVFLFMAPVLTLVSAFSFWSFTITMLFIITVLFLSKRGLRIIIPNFLFNIMVGIVTPILWNHLHEYQQNRILTFLGLKQDPQGLGYQVLQSKVAIGSGGLWGKGWTHGTQTQLRFLPEQHTDFIFSVVGEEFGFLGVSLVLLAFFFLLWRSFNIAIECRSKFSSLVVVGAVVIIAFHVIINTGMTVGIMPVTGLPLPFLSYGGSALISNMILVGLILNAGRRRFQYL